MALKCSKKVLSLAICACLFISPMAVRAQEIQDSETVTGVQDEVWRREHSGYQEMECMGGIAVTEDILAGLPAVQSDEALDEYWCNLGSDYYYDQMSDTGREIWDRIERSSQGVLLSTDNVTSVDVDCSDLHISVDDVGSIANMFRLSNPQYYFLQNRWHYASYSGSGEIFAIYIPIYEEFCDGGARKLATEQFKRQIDNWVAQIRGGKNEEDKERIAHDLIANNTIYESNALDQSAYSMVCLNKTVCAGYAATMQILMNAVGIDTIVVTSQTHAWNAIKIHGEWYLVDVTWDDYDDGQTAFYSFYNIAQMTDKDHNPLPLWTGMTPQLLYDSGSGAFSYSSPYFTEGGLEYFIVNSNPDRGLLMAKVIGTTDGSPSLTVPEVAINAFNSCTYNVIPDVMLNMDSARVDQGSMLRLTVKNTYKIGQITWSSSNSSIASVDAAGNVTGISGGRAEITAQSGAASARCVVYVAGEESAELQPTPAPQPTSEPQPTPAPQPTSEPQPTPAPQPIGDYYSTYDSCLFYRDASGDTRCYTSDGNIVINAFKCDGTYTFFFQADGTAMRDRLSYHPDGVHVIYFDAAGHEVFSDFANVRRTIAGDAVDDYCFFDTFGYLYVDVVTYDKAGKELYYANPYGVLERGKWFQFSDTVMCADGTPWLGAAGGYGYANANGTLMKDTWTYDWEGRLCYMQGNGVASY